MVQESWTPLWWPTSKLICPTIYWSKSISPQWRIRLKPRSPLLDHHVIEFAATLSENLKLHGTTSKYLLKKNAAKLVRPKAVYRRKMGFRVSSRQLVPRSIRAIFARNIDRWKEFGARPVSPRNYLTICFPTYQRRMRFYVSIVDIVDAGALVWAIYWLGSGESDKHLWYNFGWLLASKNTFVWI